MDLLIAIMVVVGSVMRSLLDLILVLLVIGALRTRWQLQPLALFDMAGRPLVMAWLRGVDRLLALSGLRAFSLSQSQRRALGVGLVLVLRWLFQLPGIVL